MKRLSVVMVFLAWFAAPANADLDAGQAYVYVGEMLVNLEMVRQGQAVIYTVPPNVAHLDEYRNAQTEAREAGRGVWNAAQPLDIAPDCYRKQEKGREC